MRVFPPKGRIDKPVVEAERSAFYFYKRYKPKKIVLCLSGGLDSEAMAESFLRAGVPFSVSIWKYKNDLNNYDIKYAIQFCKKHKLDYKMEECDLEWFYGNNLHFYYGQKYLCNSPQVVVHLHLLEKLFKNPDIAVFLPWQPPHFVYDRRKKKTCVRIIFFRYLAYYRFFKLNKVCGSPHFIICRSSLLYSFLKLPIVKHMMKDPSLLWCDGYKIKMILYRQGGFLSKPRPGKFTGFDKIKTALNKQYKIDYNRAFRYPLMRMLPDPSPQYTYVTPIWEEKDSQD